MKILGIIPARYNSVRFQGKPLSDICGKPMIWWVYQRVCAVSKFHDILVATDDQRIYDVCKGYNMRVEMTRDNHETMTSRIHEVSQAINADVYVCVNGDEPLIQSSVIEEVIPISLDNFYVSNLMTEINSPAELLDSTNIKVVTDINGKALFMSRSPIPYPKGCLNIKYYKHLGIIAFSKDALDFYASAPKGSLESSEDVDFLRFIENGRTIQMIKVISNSLSVDTPKDLKMVREILKSNYEKNGGYGD